MKERNRNPKEQCEINFFSLLPYPFSPFSVPLSTLSLSTTPKTLTTIPHIPHRPSPFPDFSFKELASPKNPFPLNLEINFSSKLFPCSKRPLCFRLPNHINLWFLSLWLYVCMYAFASYCLFYGSLCSSRSFSWRFVPCQCEMSFIVPINSAMVQENKVSFFPW